MNLASPTSELLAAAGWRAALRLGFARRGAATAMVDRWHEGPLRVQKALYPEGEAVCQAIVLHPPSGIAGGDHLSIDVHVDVDAHAQITTPGAGKWYRSGGREASQTVNLSVAPGAVLEWLPQESIVFNGAQARMTTRVALAADSRFIGWDMLCLGRAAAGERFAEGRFDLLLRIERAGRPIWLERGGFAGDDPLLHSPAGWAGNTVNGTLTCTWPNLRGEAAALLEACRALHPGDGADHGITVVGDVLLARYLGNHSEAGRQWLAALWQILRPVCCGRAALTPRIWNT